MTIKITCDGGCGFTSQSVADFDAAGFKEMKHYCSACKVKVRAFLDERDQMHNKIALDFSKCLNKLVSKFQKLHPKLRLPDIDD